MGKECEQVQSLNHQYAKGKHVSQVATGQKMNIEGKNKLPYYVMTLSSSITGEIYTYKKILMQNKGHQEEAHTNCHDARDNY
jgi:hypothetical protein